MARDYYINGPLLVKVKGIEALGTIGWTSYSPGLPNIDPVAQTHELGLCLGPVRVIPNFVHRDIYVDDYADIPPEVMASLSDVQIHMTLIHYDAEVLDRCMINSTGGFYTGQPVADAFIAGTMPGAGKLMGNGKQLYEEGNRLITLILTATTPVVLPEGANSQVKPWVFPASYIAANPMDIPLGTDRTAITLRWRAIPYVAPFEPDENNPLRSSTTPQEVSSDGASLWLREEPTD